MRKTNQIRRDSFQNLHKNLLNSVILSAICVLFIAAIFLLGIFTEGISTVLVLLVGVPFYFSCALSHYLLRKDIPITGKGLLASYISYFRPPFFGCFRVIMSFLKTLLYSFFVACFVFLIVYLVFSKEANFHSNLNALFDLFSKDFTAEEFNNIISADNEQILRFYCAITVPTSLFEYCLFTHYLFLEQINIYLRMNFPLVHPSIHKATMKALMKENRKTYYKYYYGLNFPMLILLPLGASLGAYIGYLYSGYSSISMTVFGAAGMILMSILYLPFELNNLEEIYLEFVPIYKQNNHKIMDEIKKEAEQMQNNLYHFTDFLDKSQDVVDEQNPDQEEKNE